MISTTLLFSKAISVIDLDIDIQKYKKIADAFDYKRTHADLVNMSKSHKVLDTPKMKPLKKIIENNFYDVMKEVYHYNTKFKMTTSWLVISNKQEQSQYHNHNNCMFSGVLYLQTGENTGQISFTNYENKRFNLIPTKWDDVNCSEFRIIPKNGRLIIFPSEVYHKILQNNSDIKRYSLAFNFIPTGEIGADDSTATIK